MQRLANVLGGERRKSLTCQKDNHQVTMASNDNSDLRETHRKICRELNIDADTENRSWSSFERTRDQFDLTVSGN